MHIPLVKKACVILTLSLGLAACGGEKGGSSESSPRVATDGINGSNGKDGVNGTDGKDGTNGSDGKDGSDGIDGQDGADGTDFFNLPVFNLVEADTQRIHDALAGKYKLANSTDKLTCETLVKMYIERIFKYNNNPQPNGGLPISAVLSINTNALAQARQLDALYKQDKGIGNRYLHCAPILLKDNYDTVDSPSTSASPSMLGHTAGKDSPSVIGLRKAGAVILGKAQQDEFAFFTTGFSGRTLLVTNPYNTQQSPAGSSSGTGASIAANFALGGTGSDTCQSIRHPSSVGGLVGIRPSIGVVSRKGIFPLSHTRDTGGPMTRNVRDTALMLTAMASVPSAAEDANFAVDDPDTTLFTNSGKRPTTYLKYLDRSVYGMRGKKIGIIRQLGTNTNPTGAGTVQGALIENAVKVMRANGAEIYDVYLPNYTSRGAGSSHNEVNQYFKEFIRDGGKSPRKCLSSTLGATSPNNNGCVGLDGILETLRTGPRTAPFIALSATDDANATVTAAELAAIKAERDYATNVMDGNVPNTIRAYASGNSGPVIKDVKLDVMILSPGPDGGRTCDFGSTTQMGSIVAPVGVDSSVGVPRGMEIFVRRFDEGTGIGIAYDFEQVTQHRFPPNISPSPFYQSKPIDLAAIGEFNTRIRSLINFSSMTAPQNYSQLDALRAFQYVTGREPGQ
jgi:Asp-tRNA(Asn)/Glu-tRNA(Gln) amidotransferase A subunit family amidase